MVQLNLCLNTGTVGSYLDHPRQGKTQLFRRDVLDMSQVVQFFSNSKRSHTRNCSGTVMVVAISVVIDIEAEQNIAWITITTTVNRFSCTATTS